MPTSQIVQKFDELWGHDTLLWGQSTRKHYTMTYHYENINLVHESAYGHEPLYSRRPLEWYPGRTIKMGFQSHSGEVERMWVEETGIESSDLIGVLANDPVLCTHVACGDPIKVNRLHIVSVDLTEDEWWGDVDVLRSSGDYFNRHLGSPSRQSGFGEFYYERFTPRQALNRWEKWKPSATEPLLFLTEIANSHKTEQIE